MQGDREREREAHEITLWLFGVGEGKVELAPLDFTLRGAAAAIELPPGRYVTLPTLRNIFKTLLKIVCNSTARGEHDIHWAVESSCSAPIGRLGDTPAFSLVSWHGEIVTENVALLNYASPLSLSPSGLCLVYLNSRLVPWQDTTCFPRQTVLVHESNA